MLVAAVAAVIAYLALVPLGYLLWQAFVADGSLTLASFSRAYAAIGLGEMALNSLWFVVGTTALSIGLGTVLAYLVVRTDLPFKPLILALTVTQLVIPGVLYTIAWIFLASPRSGALNTLLEPLLGPGTFDIFGLRGMVLVEALHTAPFVFLLMAVALRSMEGSLEESARVSGAGTLHVLRKITLPLLRPALYAMVLLVAIRALESFEVPALLGIPRGVWVLTTGIWRSLTHHPVDLGAASAFAVSLLAVACVGIFLLSRLSGRGRSFQTMTGRGIRARPVELGRWRWPVASAVLIYLAIAVVLPLLVLVYTSTQQYYSPPTAETLSNMSLDSYASVLSNDDTARSLRNTLVLAAGSATCVVLLGAVGAWLVVRTRVRGRGLVDGLSFLPIVIPGLVLGLALLIVYLRVPLPIYGTLWIMLIAYVTSGMPVGMRFGVASTHQIGDELEEAAHVSGASWWQTFRRVLVPLLLPALFAAWIYVFVSSARQLSAALVVYSPGNEVLSIRIWDQYQQGEFPELAALGVMMTFVLVGLIAVAYKLSGRLRW
ncbi:MAG: iron ABC transporter permease [Gaiellaceae bacterium]